MSSSVGENGVAKFPMACYLYLFLVSYFIDISTTNIHKPIELNGYNCAAELVSYYCRLPLKISHFEFIKDEIERTYAYKRTNEKKIIYY